jgi:AcrR family transcriptional regulator
VHGSWRASGQCPAKRQNLLFLPLGGSPGDGQLADAVHRGVLFESDLVQRNGDPQVRQPPEPSRPCRQNPVQPARTDARRNAERIVRAAGQVFADSGVDVFLEEIARRAGVSPATLYRHFANKHELVRAVIEQAFVDQVWTTRRAPGRCGGAVFRGARGPPRASPATGDGPRRPARRRSAPADEDGDQHPVGQRQPRQLAPRSHAAPRRAPTRRRPTLPPVTPVAAPQPSRQASASTVKR